MTPDQAEGVVSAAHAAYAALPRHGKPGVRSNGVREWTILAGVMVCAPASPPRAVALGTGVKCLPAARLPPLGDALHDSHAEVLARRGFVRWLLDEAGRVLAGTESDVLQLDDHGVWVLRDGVKLALYISLLPCGDASTLYLAAHADDATPWVTAGDGATRGRAGFAAFGALRTKPGRPDAPASISLSCSDKIAAWAALGLQGALLRAFAPVYLDAVVVGGVAVPCGEEREVWEGKVRDELRRAVYGRIEAVKGLLPRPYRLTPPEVYVTRTPFVHARPEAAGGAEGDGDGNAPSPRGDAAEPANTCLLAIAGRRPEVLVGGCVNTSAWRAPGTTLVKAKLRSAACRFEMARAYVALEGEMRAASEAAAAAAAAGVYSEETRADDTYFPTPARTTYSTSAAVVDADMTYAQLKARNAPYAAAKAVLRGGGYTPVSASWRLPHTFYATTAATAGHPAAPAPFAGWIVAGTPYASFSPAGELRRADGGEEQRS